MAREPRCDECRCGPADCHCCLACGHPILAGRCECWKYPWPKSTPLQSWRGVTWRLMHLPVTRAIRHARLLILLWRVGEGLPPPLPPPRRR